MITIKQEQIKFEQEINFCLKLSPSKLFDYLNYSGAIKHYKKANTKNQVISKLFDNYDEFCTTHNLINNF
jgi:hypothetical protein